MVSVMDEPVPVAADEIVTDVDELIPTMVAPVGMLVPAMILPRSAAVNAPVEEVTVVDELVVTPSDTERVPLDPFCATRVRPMVAFSPTLAAISAAPTLAPVTVNGWTVPSFAGRPSCHVADGSVPGRNVWVYGPEPVVLADPKICSNSLPAERS